MYIFSSIKRCFISGMAVSVLLLSGLPDITPVKAQTKEDSPSEQAALRQQMEAERLMRRADNRRGSGTASEGHLSFRNFLLGGMHTGNLISVPYINNLNVSAGYYSGLVPQRFMQWPRGSGVNYGHTFSFGICAEVTNEAGRSMPICSEAYNRGGKPGAGWLSCLSLAAYSWLL